MKRMSATLMNPAHPSVRRRLVLLAVFGIGLPVLVLAALAILQTSHIARFLRETTKEYGTYAARLVSNTLENEISKRAHAAAEPARLAAGWGGASPAFLRLLETTDPLFADPFITPVEVVRAQLVTVTGVAPDTTAIPMGPISALSPELPGAATPAHAATAAAPSRAASDSTIVPVPVARDEAEGLDAPLALPAWAWRSVAEAREDTMIVVPRNAIAPGSSAFVLMPLIGFPGRVVAVAGWRFNAAGIQHRYLHEIVEREVYQDPRVFRGDVIQKSLAILLFNPDGEEVFRSREIGSKDTWVERRIGGLLPGWTVAAAPSKDNAYVVIRRFVLFEYGLMLVLLGLALAALFLGLRLAVQQVEVAELKSSFMANVSHELKTPLSLIRMASETLTLGRVRSADESQRFLATITRECRRLTHMIDNVLDFAKIEEGRRTFVFTPVDLRKLVSDTLEFFQPQIEEQRFALTVDLPKEMPPVEADAQAITQCLINLLDNAIKYSRERKELTVRVTSDGATARVAVSDRGMGVAPRDAERIFEKFTRAETGLVHNVKGSGLGLALVRHIARAHGGDVELESVPGEGSTFTLVLPMRQEGRKEGNGWQPRS